MQVRRFVRHLPRSAGLLVRATKEASLLGEVKEEDSQLLEDAGDLLLRLLEWDPEKRITAAEALKHPFVASLEESDEDFDEEVERLDPQLFAFEERYEKAPPSMKLQIVIGTLLR